MNTIKTGTLALIRVRGIRAVWNEFGNDGAGVVYIENPATLGWHRATTFLEVLRLLGY